MRYRTLLVLAGLAALAAAPLPGQDAATAVRPGMTEADVTARWGDPVAVRRVNDWTYLFFRNGQERELGFYDTVFLQGGQVVDAVVRSPDHVYLGTSSSPPGRIPEFTPPRQPPGIGAAGEVTGVRVNAPRAPDMPAPSER
jgi:hypothetical protein